MNWPWKKKKLSFAETAKFNWEADTNEELRQKLNELAKQYPTLRESEYREKLLSLFRERGLDLNAEQLDMLLLLLIHELLHRKQHAKARGGDILQLRQIKHKTRDAIDAAAELLLQLRRGRRVQSSLQSDRQSRSA